MHEKYVLIIKIVFGPSKLYILYNLRGCVVNLSILRKNWHNNILLFYTLLYIEHLVEILTDLLQSFIMKSAKIVIISDSTYNAKDFCLNKLYKKWIWSISLCVFTCVFSYF